MKLPRRYHYLWKSLLLVAIAANLGGCFGGGSGAQDYYYRLDLPTPDPRSDLPVLNGTIQIVRPRADALTSERHLLYRENGQSSQIYRYAYHRWVDSPTLIVQQEMARFFRTSGLADQVITPEFRAKADFMLSCRIAKLERILDTPTRVVMELELGLIRVKDRRTVLLRTYKEEQITNGEGMIASIDAYNQTLARILSRFLDDVTDLPEKGSRT